MTDLTELVPPEPPALTITERSELVLDQSAAIYPALAALLGIPESGGGVGVPVILYGADVAVEVSRSDLIQVTVPVTITLLGDDAVELLALLRGAAHR